MRLLNFSILCISSKLGGSRFWENETYWEYTADLRQVPLLSVSNSERTMDLGPLSGGYNGIQFCVTFLPLSDSCIPET